MYWLALPLALMLVVIAVTVQTLRASKQRAVRQKQGLLLLQHLRVLLAELQQHRGLSSGLLNGAKELEGKLRTLQKDISNKKSDINQQFIWPANNQRWLSIIDHWQRLESRFTSYTLNHNIEQHNTLIQSLLFLIDDMAQAHDLLILHVDGKPLVSVWRELLTAAECIGQLRAMGTAVAASGECNSVARIRLNYLCQKIDAATKVAWQTLPPSKDHKSQLSELNQYVNQAFIERQQAANAESYFALATKAIDGVYQQFDSAIDAARH